MNLFEDMTFDNKREQFNMMQQQKIYQLMLGCKYSL